MPTSRKIICLTGMPGAGKGIVSDIAKTIGIPVYVMGDVVREEATRRGLPHKPEILNAIAKELREKEGPAAVAKRVASKIAGTKSGIILIDGIRSLHEVNVFKEYGDIVIIAVHASPKTRFERLRKRNRPGDPKTWDEFVSRDFLELGFGIGNVIALADYMIVNEEDRDKAVEHASRILARLVEDAKD